MQRAITRELLDDIHIPEHLVEPAYRDLTRIHRWIGDTAYAKRLLLGVPLSLGRVLDIGCARGGSIAELQNALGIEVIGVDIRDWPGRAQGVQIVIANATCDPLPPADAALAMHVTHHLSESEVIELIRNVSRYCRRFIIIDLVRHWLPLFLFRAFVAPWVGRVAAADGATSVRRAFLPVELADLVRSALAETGGSFTHRVSPFYVRQVVDITFP